MWSFDSFEAWLRAVLQEVIDLEWFMLGFNVATDIVYEIVKSYSVVLRSLIRRSITEELEVNKTPLNGSAD